MLSWSPDTFVCSTSGSASKTMLSTPAADTEPATKMYKTTRIKEAIAKVDYSKQHCPHQSVDQLNYKCCSQVYANEED